MNHQRLFQTREQTKPLPNPLFSPSIVRMWRCDHCETVDKRSWFPTADAAIEASKHRGAPWACRECSSSRSTLIRCWFATVFEQY